MRLSPSTTEGPESQMLKPLSVHFFRLFILVTYVTIGMLCCLGKMCVCFTSSVYWMRG